MLENGIDTKDISVVVQGAVDKTVTPRCIESIRKYLPDAQIILSTWAGTGVTELDYDKVILNPDPGGFPMSPWETNNVKRQIASTLEGLKQANRKYALKIRSDMQLISSSFLEYFDKFNSYDKNWHFLKKRIIIPSLITRDPRIWESPMCPSDWCSFGLREDMLSLWNIDFPTEEEQQWFKYHQRPLSVQYYYDPLISRFNPEQFIWIGFVKKFVKNLHAQHMFDINERSIFETLSSFANNLIILSERQYGIKFLKAHRKNGDRWHIITHNDFLKIYNEYANARAKIPVIDFQRLGALKSTYGSCKRLFKLADNHHCIAHFFDSETKYFSPFLHSLALPIIKIVQLIEQDGYPCQFSYVNAENNVIFSIVIPVHNNINYYRQTLDSLRLQEFKEFEVVVSDDSTHQKDRMQIQHELNAFNGETGINVKYIYTTRNLGQSKNTNQGLSLAEGQWIRILHSDDMLHRLCLKREYDILAERSKAVAIFHDMKPFSKSEDVDLSAPVERRYAEHHADFIVTNALHTHCAAPSSLLFRADLLGKIGGFNDNLARACDWDFWSRIVLYAMEEDKTLIHVQDNLVYYRIHSKSNTNKITTKLKNYFEYKAISENVKNIIKSEYGGGGGNIYINCAFAYRKKRLINDYKSLPTLFKMMYWFDYYKKLVDV